MMIEKREIKATKRGRPAKQKETTAFDTSAIKLCRGNDL